MIQSSDSFESLEKHQCISSNTKKMNIYAQESIPSMRNVVFQKIGQKFLWNFTVSSYNQRSNEIMLTLF
ncbi:hypothetical protein L3Y34_017170 [Caenorhabditis briggsae]|uniref:Uncharacterized protein n=1 Tax=Caenorhabditis briggsae TaxID=6238 RepID=A0AAE9DI14_CAEBR|nr:hypothetical protein L3Y34_017170 [Caenorhabditis briggsae]